LRLGVAIFAALMCAAAPGRSRAASALDRLYFPPTDFSILSADGSHVIGHSRFELVRDHEGAVLRGENRFLSGEYDIETDRLATRAGESLPVLTEFNHQFFKADGSPMMSGRADLVSGQTTCIGYEATAGVHSETLDFPPDTWAGASVMIPMQALLRDGAGSDFRLHVFSCTPSPRLITVEVRPDDRPRPWTHYRGAVVEVEVRPKFGWWDVIIAPFIPKLHAWFDPERNFAFVGARLARFWRGPEIILAATPPGETPEPGAKP
jgi:hypothetical protein